MSSHLIQTPSPPSSRCLSSGSNPIGKEGGSSAKISFLFRNSDGVGIDSGANSSNKNSSSHPSGGGGGGGGEVSDASDLGVVCSGQTSTIRSLDFPFLSHSPSSVSFSTPSALRPLPPAPVFRPQDWNPLLSLNPGAVATTAFPTRGGEKTHRTKKISKSGILPSPNPHTLHSSTSSRRSGSAGMTGAAAAVPPPTTTRGVMETAFSAATVPLSRHKAKLEECALLHQQLEKTNAELAIAQQRIQGFQREASNMITEVNRLHDVMKVWTSELSAKERRLHHLELENKNIRHELAQAREDMEVLTASRAVLQRKKELLYGKGGNHPHPYCHGDGGGAGAASLRAREDAFYRQFPPQMMESEMGDGAGGAGGARASYIPLCSSAFEDKVVIGKGGGGHSPSSLAAVRITSAALGPEARVPISFIHASGELIEDGGEMSSTRSMLVAANGGHMGESELARGEDPQQYPLNNNNNEEEEEGDMEEVEEVVYEEREVEEEIEEEVEVTPGLPHYSPPSAKPPPLTTLDVDSSVQDNRRLPMDVVLTNNGNNNSDNHSDGEKDQQVTAIPNIEPSSLSSSPSPVQARGSLDDHYSHEMDPRTYNVSPQPLRYRRTRKVMMLKQVPIVKMVKKRKGKLMDGEGGGNSPPPRTSTGGGAPRCILDRLTPTHRPRDVNNEVLLEYMTTCFHQGCAPHVEVLRSLYRGDGMMVMSSPPISFEQLSTHAQLLCSPIPSLLGMWSATHLHSLSLRCADTSSGVPLLTTMLPHVPHLEKLEVFAISTTVSMQRFVEAVGAASSIQVLSLPQLCVHDEALLLLWDLLRQRNDCHKIAEDARRREEAEQGGGEAAVKRHEEQKERRRRRRSQASTVSSTNGGAGTIAATTTSATSSFSTSPHLAHSTSHCTSSVNGIPPAPPQPCEDSFVLNDGGVPSGLRPQRLSVPILDLSHCHVEDPMTIKRICCPGVHVLFLAGLSHSVTDVGLHGVLKEGCPSLHTLDLSGCTRLTAQALQDYTNRHAHLLVLRLEQCPQIRTLHLRHVQVLYSPLNFVESLCMPSLRRLPIPIENRAVLQRFSAPLLEEMSLHGMMIESHTMQPALMFTVEEEKRLQMYERDRTVARECRRDARHHQRERIQAENALRHPKESPAPESSPPGEGEEVKVSGRGSISSRNSSTVATSPTEGATLFTTNAVPALFPMTEEGRSLSTISTFGPNNHNGPGAGIGGGCSPSQILELLAGGKARGGGGETRTSSQGTGTTVAPVAASTASPSYRVSLPPHLRSVSFIQCDFTDPAELTRFLSYQDQLVSLTLHRCTGVLDSHMALLPKTLKHLDVAFAGSLSDAALRSIVTRAPFLVHLNLKQAAGGGRITKDGIHALYGLSWLQHLNLLGLSPDNVPGSLVSAVVRSLPQLVELYHETAIVGEGRSGDGGETPTASETPLGIQHLRPAASPPYSPTTTTPTTNTIQHRPTANSAFLHIYRTDKEREWMKQVADAPLQLLRLRHSTALKLWLESTAIPPEPQSTLWPAAEFHSMHAAAARARPALLYTPVPPCAWMANHPIRPGCTPLHTQPNDMAALHHPSTPSLSSKSCTMLTASTVYGLVPPCSATKKSGRGGTKRSLRRPHGVDGTGERQEEGQQQQEEEEEGGEGSYTTSTSVSTSYSHSGGRGGKSENGGGIGIVPLTRARDEEAMEPAYYYLPPKTVSAPSASYSMEEPSAATAYSHPSGSGRGIHSTSMETDLVVDDEESGRRGEGVSSCPHHASARPSLFTLSPEEHAALRRKRAALEVSFSSTSEEGMDHEEKEEEERNERSRDALGHTNSNNEVPPQLDSGAAVKEEEEEAEGRGGDGVSYPHSTDGGQTPPSHLSAHGSGTVLVNPNEPALPALPRGSQSGSNSNTTSGGSSSRSSGGAPSGCLPTLRGNGSHHHQRHANGNSSSHTDHATTSAAAAAGGGGMGSARNVHSGGPSSPLEEEGGQEIKPWGEEDHMGEQKR